MKLSTNPFSLYDFLGYFLTGFLCLYLLNFGISSDLLHSDFLLSIKAKYIIHEQSEFDFIFVIILCYITGHILSFISSITIEQYNVFVYKYPSQSLLNKKNSKASFNDFFKSDFFGQYRVKNLLRLCLLLLLFPLVLMDLFFGHLLGFKHYFSRSINESLIPLVDKKLAKVYSTRFLEETDHENETHTVDEYFLPVYHFLIDRSEVHHTKTQNYVALYGLLRNMTLLMVALSWLLAFSFNTNEILLSVYLILSSLCVTYIFFLGYLKFFRRFSKEVIFGVLSCELPPSKSKSISKPAKKKKPPIKKKKK